MSRVSCGYFKVKIAAWATEGWPCGMYGRLASCCVSPWRPCTRRTMSARRSKTRSTVSCLQVQRNEMHHAWPIERSELCGFSFGSCRHKQSRPARRRRQQSAVCVSIREVCTGAGLKLLNVVSSRGCEKQISGENVMRSISCCAHAKVDDMAKCCAASNASSACTEEAKSTGRAVWTSANGHPRTDLLFSIRSGTVNNQLLRPRWKG